MNQLAIDFSLAYLKEYGFASKYLFRVKVPVICMYLKMKYRTYSSQRKDHFRKITAIVGK